MTAAEKRPRHWAAEIAALKTLAERRDALTQVPEQYQDLVKKHLQLIWGARDGAK